MLVERYYLSPLVGTGTDDDPRRPAVAECPHAGYAMRDAGDAERNRALVHVLASENQHKAILALDGVDLAPDDPDSIEGLRVDDDPSLRGRSNA